MAEIERLTEKKIRELERDGFHVIDEPRIYASISKLAEMTGRDRHTVADRVRELTHHPGPKSAQLYPTDLALRVIMSRG